MLMKILRRAAVHIREGVRGVWRNKGLAITSMITMSVTLLFVSATIILSVNVNHFTELVKEDLTLLVTLDLEISESRAKEVSEELLLLSHVVVADFSSKESERVRMKGDWPEMSEILDYYQEDNPLFNTVYIKVDDVNAIDMVITNVKKHPDVEDVIFLKDLVDSMLFVFETIQYVGLALMATLLLVTLVVISNTIKITIYSRKQSIEIMRLIGAKKGYIVAPHIVEGLIIGILGSLIPMGLTYYAYNKFFEITGGELLSSPFLKFVEPATFIHYVLLGLLAVSVFVSVLGSRRSVRKFMRGK